jgi:hypothetical protein
MSGLRSFPGASSATSPSGHSSGWLTGSFSAGFPSATASNPSARRKTTGRVLPRAAWLSITLGRFLQHRTTDEALRL